MNRTLLLILCDFLLLTLLSLTKWETAEPERPETEISAAVDAAGGATPASDIVDLMKLSFEDEQARQVALAAQLDATAQSLAQRESTVNDLQAERERLEQARLRLEGERAQLAATLDSTVDAATTTAAELRNQVAAVRGEADASRARMEQLQRDLEQRENEATNREQELAKMAEAQTVAQARIQDLNVAVKVAEQEKVLLRETADSYRTQAANERTERIKVQETTVQLAEGVGQLAEKSAELREDIRANRPINANTLFSDFLLNRVPTSFSATRPGLLSDTNRDTTTRTVLVSDGASTYAVLHLEDTPFRVYEPVAQWSRLTVTLSKNDFRFSAPEISFLQRDPRIVVIPVNPFQLASLNVKIYTIARDPFRFPEAVLISNGGQGYGEVPFKLDQELPGYVRMDNRLLRRLFGDFSPSQGDLVLSKTGELLGVMVSSDLCALVDNFLPMATLVTGDLSGQDMVGILENVQSRLGRRITRPGGR
jgi:hypothetical protein